MNFKDLLDTRINYENLVKEKLEEMVLFFLTHVKENHIDKPITLEDAEAIRALKGKIIHMTFRIGCPNSVEPMLRSIASRKIKYWQAHNNVQERGKPFSIKDVLNGETYSKKYYKRGWFGKGKQITSIEDKARVLKTDDYYHLPQNERVLKGHFRWNNRGYTLSRNATDILSLYLETKF